VSIQLPQVIASIARDLSRAIDAESSSHGALLESGPSVAELLRRMTDSGGTVPAPSSGYLQIIQHETLIAGSRNIHGSSRSASGGDGVICAPHIGTIGCLGHRSLAGLEDQRRLLQKGALLLGDRVLDDPRERLA